MIARFLGVRVWDLTRVAVHYQEEARVILQGRFDTQMRLAQKFKVSPEKIILPEY